MKRSTASAAMAATLRDTRKLLGFCRSLSTGPSIFDRGLKRKQRNNAAVGTKSRDYDYLRTLAAENLVERLQDINKSFPQALNLGASHGSIRQALEGMGATCPVEKLIQCDMAEKMLVRDLNEETSALEKVKTMKVLADEEFLPFAADTFDIVFSSMAMHWVNDIPGTLSQVLHCLKPDGVFLGSMLGGQTLKELRSVFLLAEQERLGGVSQRTSPMTTLADMGNLLQGSGFALPTIDVQRVETHFDSMFHLLEHLQGMGENSALQRKPPKLSRDVLLAAAALYDGMFGNDDGSVTATFEIIYMIGWKPHSSQPAPLRRGSAQKSMKELQK